MNPKSTDRRRFLTIAPTNLMIPPHRYLNDDTVEIGMDDNVQSTI